MEEGTVAADEYINADEYKKEIEEARQELFALIWSKRCAPLLLKLAFNDAATFEGGEMTGGPNGSIRMEEEYTQPCNQGLKLAIDYCEHIKRMQSMITYADIYQLAGVVAVQATGGPNIDIMFGRKDSEK